MQVSPFLAAGRICMALAHHKAGQLVLCAVVRRGRVLHYVVESQVVVVKPAQDSKTQT